MSLRIALYQSEIKWEDKEYNLKKSVEAIETAALSGTDLVLLPEMSFTGFSMNVNTTMDNDALCLEKMKVYAKKYAVYIGFGWVKKTGVLAENCYTIVNPSGEVILHYTKIHPFSYTGEHKYFKSGEEVCFCDIKGLPMSVFICYDLRFPELFQHASEKTAAIIIPANWPDARRSHWDCLLQARAIETQAYIIGVNCIGYQGALYYSGGSRVIHPNGDIIGALADEGGANLLLCDIANDVGGYRQEFPVKQDRKPEFYKTFY